jgi:DNA modification methylase
MVETASKTPTKPKRGRGKSKLTLPKEWASSEIVPQKVDDLLPYARNARTHSKAQIEKLASGMREFGFTNPVICDENGMIIAGHGRVEAAKKLGLEAVPTLIARGWSEAKKRAYVLADNRLALDAGWDDEMLTAELAELANSDFDMALTGFDERELTKILADGLKNENEDGVPEKPQQDYTVSRPGDIWCLGAHRLIIGSCTHEQTVKTLLAGVVPGLMVTDPPYGVNYDPEWRNKALGEAKRSTGKVQNDDQADWSEAWALFQGSVAYVWHAGLFSHVVRESLTSTGFEMRAQIIWRKPHFVISRGAYHSQHEPCWYAVRKGKNADWRGARDQSTVWDIGNAGFGKTNDTGEDEKTIHGTQKPVEVYRRSILNHTSEGQAVYDPFSGSGTLFVACEVTGRVAYGCEIDTGYGDVIVERWQNLTGETATLLESGKTFEEARKTRKSS